MPTTRLLATLLHLSPCLNFYQNRPAVPLSPIPLTLTYSRLTTTLRVCPMRHARPMAYGVGQQQRKNSLV